MLPSPSVARLTTLFLYSPLQPRFSHLTFMTNPTLYFRRLTHGTRRSASIHTMLDHRSNSVRMFTILRIPAGTRLTTPILQPSLQPRPLSYLRGNFILGFLGYWCTTLGGVHPRYVGSSIALRKNLHNSVELFRSLSDNHDLTYIHPFNQDYFLSYLHDNFIL